MPIIPFKMVTGIALLYVPHINVSHLVCVSQVPGEALHLCPHWMKLSSGLSLSTRPPPLLLPPTMSSSSSCSSSVETSPEDMPRGGGTIRVYLPNKQRTVVGGCSRVTHLRLNVSDILAAGPGFAMLILVTGLIFMKHIKNTHHDSWPELVWFLTYAAVLQEHCSLSADSCHLGINTENINAIDFKMPFYWWQETCLVLHF